MQGGTGGFKDSFDLDSNEHITSLSLQYGEYLGGITITTDQGRFCCYGSNKTSHLTKFSEECNKRWKGKVKSIFVEEGQYIKAIQCAIVTDDKKQYIQDINCVFSKTEELRWFDIYHDHGIDSIGCFSTRPVSSKKITEQQKENERLYKNTIQDLQNKNKEWIERAIQEKTNLIDNFESVLHEKYNEIDNIQKEINQVREAANLTENADKNRELLNNIYTTFDIEQKTELQNIEATNQADKNKTFN